MLKPLETEVSVKVVFYKARIMHLYLSQLPGTLRSFNSNFKGVGLYKSLILNFVKQFLTVVAKVKMFNYFVLFVFVALSHSSPVRQGQDPVPPVPAPVPAAAPAAPVAPVAPAASGKNL